VITAGALSPFPHFPLLLAARLYFSVAGKISGRVTAGNKISANVQERTARLFPSVFGHSTFRSYFNFPNFLAKFAK
jgi:hypothetical protein